jgi:bifunctional DNase/RNase
LQVLGIRYTYSQAQVGAYALVLGEENSIRRVRIIIGTPEAQSIALQLENITPPRPLTHDLFIIFAKSFNIRLVEVFISKFEEGMFYSELLFDDGVNQVRIDSRTSDAIALALRSKCPIYITEDIMQQVGEVFEEDLSQDDSLSTSGDIDEYTIEDLYSRLDEAVKSEDYETASAIRDEIKRREADQ